MGWLYLKNKTHVCGTYKTLTLEIKSHSETERMDKIFHANGNDRKVGVG